MSEALEWAADYCDRTKMFEPPTNARGYVLDGWKAIPPAERANIITNLARTVVDSEGDERIESTLNLETVKAIRKNLAEEVDNPKYTSPSSEAVAYAAVIRHSIDQLDSIIRASERKP